MDLFKNLFITILAAFVLSHCTAFKKHIDKPVVVVISDTLFTTALNPVTAYPKYLDHATTGQYAQSFLRGFTSEAKITPNVSLRYNEAEADFIVRVKSITLTESARLEKVNDPKSPYNGQELELNTVECSAILEITDVKNKTKALSSCTNIKSRSEQITNQRNLDDLVNGKNKDKKYRTKLLDDNICLRLSEDVGRRIWVPITRRIAGDLK